MSQSDVGLRRVGRLGRERALEQKSGILGFALVPPVPLGDLQGSRRVIRQRQSKPGVFAQMQRIAARFAAANRASSSAACLRQLRSLQHPQSDRRAQQLAVVAQVVAEDRRAASAGRPWSSSRSARALIVNASCGSRRSAVWSLSLCGFRIAEQHRDLGEVADAISIVRLAAGSGSARG